MSAARAIQPWLLGLFLIGLAFSITLSETALVLLTICWFLRLRERSARVVQAFPLAWPVLAFVGATLLSALRSSTPVASLASSHGLLLLLTFYVLLDALADVQAADRFLTRLFLLLAVHAGLSVIQVTLCPRDPWGLPLVGRFFRGCARAHGFFSIYMTLAGVLTLSLLATLPRLVVRGRARWGWTVLTWLISGLGFLLTQTRGAWIGFLTGATALTLHLRRLAALVAIGGALLLVVLLLIPSGTLRERFGNLEDPTTLRERVYMWQSAWAIVRDHPLTGVGVGRVKAVFPRYALPQAIKKTTSHVHNTPLQILAERGLFGLAAWLWLWIAFFVHALRILRRVRPDQRRGRDLVAGSLAAIIGFLVAGLFEFNFGDSEVVLVAYAVMTLPFVVERSLALRPP